MDIFLLENKLETINDPKLRQIFEIIIEAVNDYPIYNLHDTNAYFKEVMKLLKADEITLSLLEIYLQLNKDLGHENAIWEYHSLSTLFEAFTLMMTYKIPFNNVLECLNSLK